MYELSQKILGQVRSVIKGKDEVSKKVFAAILAQGHVLLEDVPGVGKTTLALAFSAALGLDARRVQCTPDTMPSDIIGYSMPDREHGGMRYQPGAVMTNLLLADEINRTSSKTQSALLEAMEERQVTVDGQTHPLPDPFIVLATQNPVGSAGTQLLPQAQLDRFLMCLSIGYPDMESQIAILKDRHHENPLDSLTPCTDARGLLEMIRTVENIFVADSIYVYITQLAQQSRADAELLLGISPRGALAVCKAAKATAFLNGRDYVTPQDVQEIFADVCAHRIVTDSKARLQAHSSRSILERILHEVTPPETRPYGK